MSSQLKKITEQQMDAVGVVAAPNVLNGTPAENKAIFDRMVRQLIAQSYNELVDVLQEAGVEHAALLPENAAGFRYIRLNADKVLEVSTDGTTWQATGSSGHLILDADGEELPQRSRMQFAGCEVTDDGTKTIIHGVKGDQGETGATGPTGPQGPKGEKGDTGLAVIPSVDQDTGLMSFRLGEAGAVPAPVYVRGPQGPQGEQGLQGPAGVMGPQGPRGEAGAKGDKGDKGEKGDTGATGPQGPQGLKGDQGPQGIQGPKGDKGNDGRSFEIEDVYPTLAALRTALPNGADGAYQVASSGELYIWSESNMDWVSIGALQGPQGPQGVQGVQGPAGPQGETGPQGPQGEQGIQGEKGDTGETGAQGPKGDTGAAGAQGEQGVQGVQGPAGPTGPEGKSAYQSARDGGYTGTEAEFNASLNPANYAPKSHTHRKSDITDFPASMAPTAHKASHKTGGSDAIAPADIGAAAATHNHTKSQITDFPASMAPTAHKATHKTGGSDAIAPADIGAAAKQVVVPITLTVAGWNASTKRQVATVAGVLADASRQVIQMGFSTEAAILAYAEAGILAVAQGAGTLTFQCSTVPEADIAVNIIIQPL